jgi:hypothetical protein
MGHDAPWLCGYPVHGVSSETEWASISAGLIRAIEGLNGKADPKAFVYFQPSRRGHEKVFCHCRYGSGVRRNFHWRIRRASDDRFFWNSVWIKFKSIRFSGFPR